MIFVIILFATLGEPGLAFLLNFILWEGKLPSLEEGTWEQQLLRDY